MKRTCTVSGQEFEITEEDLKFYDKMGVPTPTLCPEERMRRRLAWRNERSLYHRECAATGKKIISMYSPESRVPVYENDYWWGDSWDAQEYGRDFDFSRPFFEQFQALVSQVPKMARIQQGENENSQFTNCASYNKNSYLITTASRCEDCLYGTFVVGDRSSVDNLYLLDSELCYECVNSEKCYNSKFLQNSKNCTDSYFLKNCIGCTNCFGCMNLRNKEYYFLNESLGKEAYLNKIEELKLQNYSHLKDLRSHFTRFVLQFPHRFAEEIQNQNCSGDHILFSKNSLDCFDSHLLEDSKFINDSEAFKTCYDMSFYGGKNETNELCYECEGSGHGVFEVKFSRLIWGGSSDIDYSYECFSSQKLFGCIGLKQQKYCILNKQYSKEEYFELREKIIAHMKETGEWGEFFPIEMSPFGYNETVAQEYFPLTEEVARSKGYKWHEEKELAKYEGPKYEISDSIEDVSDDILKQVLTCEVSGKNYRIVKPELDFYRKMNLPIPRLCPDERHCQRMVLRNPRKLWDRKCDKCGVDIQTTFAPNRPERVYCEKCYNEAVD